MNARHNRASRRWLLTALAVTIALPPPAMADIVSTDQLAAPAQLEAERAQVKAFLERATVIEKMQALGVDSGDVAGRIDAMSHEEIHTLARNINSAPAGGEFTTTEIIVIVLLAILVAIIL